MSYTAETRPADPLQPQPPQLGPRLGALYDWVAQAQITSTYDNLWDCCCDHGYLGIQLLANQLAPQIHFVDQASHLIDALHPRLATYGLSGYHALGADASELRFAAQQSHLIIIAGVGGEHTVDIVRAIVANHPQQSLDFMFCPTTTQFDLREYLAESPFQLLHETLVSEKGREYEVIAVRHTGATITGATITDTTLTGTTITDAPISGRRVTSTGEHWDLSDPAHHRYLSKLITHYRRCTLGSQATEAQRILDCYLATWDRLAL